MIAFESPALETCFLLHKLNKLGSGCLSQVLQRVASQCPHKQAAWEGCSIVLHREGSLLYSDTEQAACRGLQGLLLLLEPSGAKEATKDRRRTFREESDKPVFSTCATDESMYFS